jgi:hypothetical protein
MCMSALLHGSTFKGTSTTTTKLRPPCYLFIFYEIKLQSLEQFPKFVTTLTFTITRFTSVAALVGSHFIISQDHNAYFIYDRLLKMYVPWRCGGFYWRDCQTNFHEILSVQKAYNERQTLTLTWRFYRNIFRCKVMTETYSVLCWKGRNNRVGAKDSGLRLL